MDHTGIEATAHVMAKRGALSQQTDQRVLDCRYSLGFLA
jgi:hypothetical protein